MMCGRTPVRPHILLITLRKHIWVVCPCGLDQYGRIGFHAVRMEKMYKARSANI